MAKMREINLFLQICSEDQHGIKLRPPQGKLYSDDMWTAETLKESHGSGQARVK